MNGNVRLQALKEWAAAIAALGSGDTIALLRKGGIREREFLVKERRVLLYPTAFHQAAQSLKPAYAALATDIDDAAPAIADWAEITHCLTLVSPENLQALYPFHIWTEAFVRQRLAWKPERPLQLLLLRVYRFPTPIMLPERPQGCRSWFEVTVAQSQLPTAWPALESDYYREQVEAILQALGTATDARNERATGDRSMANPQQ